MNYRNESPLFFPPPFTGEVDRRRASGGGTEGGQQAFAPPLRSQELAQHRPRKRGRKVRVTFIPPIRLLPQGLR